MADCQCMDKAKYPEYWRVCPYATPPRAQAIEARKRQDAKAGLARKGESAVAEGDAA